MGGDLVLILIWSQLKQIRKLCKLKSMSRDSWLSIDCLRGSLTTITGPFYIFLQCLKCAPVFSCASPPTSSDFYENRNGYVFNHVWPMLLSQNKVSNSHHTLYGILGARLTQIQGITYLYIRKEPTGHLCWADTEYRHWMRYDMDLQIRQVFEEMHTDSPRIHN